MTVIHRNLPRLLALYNTDITHPLCGCGDRRFWAWKLIDFPNGTYQGAAFGLSKLLVSDLLPATLDKASLQLRIEQMIEVIPKLTDAHGAVGEALPNEGSFCVTGLVLADCLGAIETLGERLSEERHNTLMNALSPLANFLMRQDETHGIISNHLATCALAMVRWSEATQSKSALDRARMWIDRIKVHSSKEGWMKEYSGADPGYQSWCTSSLAQIAQITDELDIQSLLDISFEFMEVFALPDGSFSNGCGSRLTRFFMPGGAELQKEHSKAAMRLCKFARQHIGENTFVGLDAIDEPNLIPFFNDLVIAAVNAEKIGKVDSPDLENRYFNEASLSRITSEDKIMIINTKRGGWFCTIFSNGTNEVSLEPAAVGSKGQVLRPVRGTFHSQSSTVMIIEAELEPVERMLPSPFKFIVLRILSLTFFRSTFLGNWVKRLMAKLLMSEGKTVKGRVRRTIDLQSGTSSDVILDGDAVLIENPRSFSPLHMASQGYWQVSDDTKT